MTAPACLSRAIDPADWPAADRIDLRWVDGAPCLLVWRDDGDALAYPLPPGEVYDLVRRLVGYLGYLWETPVERVEG